MISQLRRLLDKSKKKRYGEALKEYVGEVVLVGINYDKETKRHECVIEKLSKERLLEEGGQKKVVRKGGQNTVAIFKLIKENPFITREQLSTEVHIAPSAVQKAY